MDKKIKINIPFFIVILITAVISLSAAASFGRMYVPDTVYPADGFKKHMLSEWFAALAGSPLDTEVYIQDSGIEGGSILVLGGTHPNEPASALAATVILENAKVSVGRLFVIPFTNKSGFTHNSPQEAFPQFIHFTLADGTMRKFRIGSRLVNPVDIWPNPDIYYHYPSGQQLSGADAGNLNRCYPGRPDGSSAEQLAFSILELIRQEDITLGFDIHEASPEYPVIDAIVAHENAMDLAAAVILDLEPLGVSMRLEPSPPNFRGLTHREWGDNSNIMAILMESGNPVQGRLRGKTDEALAITGEDKAYKQASKLGRLFIPYVDDQPISLRVARHIESIQLFSEWLGFLAEGKEIFIEGLPRYDELIENGVENYLSGGKK